MTEDPVDAVEPDGSASSEAAAVTPRGAEATAEQTAQSELDLGVVPTGSAVVDDALRPLESLGERPVAEHAEAYEQVLADLTETMRDPAAGRPTDAGEPTVPR